MEYYAAVRKDEVMKFAYNWINIESSMLTEMSQKEETDIERLHSYVEYKVAERYKLAMMQFLADISLDLVTKILKYRNPKPCGR